MARSGGLLVLLLLVLHGSLLAWSGYSHSPAYSEVFQLPAGVSHLKLRRFDVFRVNPPLVRSVAAIPVVLAAPHTNWCAYEADPLTRCEYGVGLDFLTANDSRSIWLTTLARWACIPFSVAGGLVCFSWARRLYGLPSGFVALVLWITSPYVLGHAALMTADAHAAAMGVAAGYFYWRWLRKPSMAMAVVAGVVLGTAELAKLTLVVFYPLLPAMWGVYRFLDDERDTKRWIAEMGQLLTLMMVSILVINIGYGFEESGRRLGDFRFKSLVLTGCENVALAAKGGNRFTGTVWGALPVPLPANYLQGVDTQKADFERRPFSYMHGRWQRGGWWYFYFYALCVKVPLGTWCLVVLAIGGALSSRKYRANWADEIVVAMPIIAMFLLLTSQSGLSLHSRYVLPLLPFAFVWVSKVARAFDCGHVGIACLVSVCLGWTVGSSLYCYPHSLSYFNELVGGPRNGYRHLALSNSSWQQDLLHLKAWYDEHPEAKQMRIASCGPFDPRFAGLNSSCRL